MITSTNSQNADINNYRKAGTTTYSALYTQAISSITLTTTGGLSKDLIHAVPLIITDPCTIDRLGIEITVAGTASSLSRIGIYNDNGNTGPGTLLVDAGTIANDSATLQLKTINQNLVPGLYWLAFVMNSNSSPTFRTVPIAGLSSILGMPTTGGANPNTLIVPAFTYAALPSTFPSYSGTDIISTINIAFFMRFST